MILTACLSCSPNHDDLDPVDKAIVSQLDNHPQIKQSLEKYKISEYVPFNLKALRTWAWAETYDGQRTLCTKGTPNALLNLCSAASEVGEEYRKMATKFAGQGYRSLGVARKSENGEWELLGLLPIFDPPREDTPAAIKTAKNLGIKVKMMTGDAVPIAQESARIFGLGTNVINADLSADECALSDSEFSTAVEAADGYTEVFHEHKERIVRIHHRRGHRVAATGDGASNAYLLKRADCGIAVEGSSEIAMPASDIYMQIPSWIAGNAWGTSSLTRDLLYGLGVCCISYYDFFALDMRPAWIPHSVQ